MNSFDYERHILILDDTELEQLVRKWAVHQTQKNYVSSYRHGGSGDMGRDVVGFYSVEKHEGEWDNYQCKQYSTALPTDQGMAELGKILYYAYEGNFTAPLAYYFVAPKGINKNLRRLIENPSKLKITLIDKWDHYCKNKITARTEVFLTDELRSFISKYDFSRVEIVDVDRIVFDSTFRAVLVEEFGGELLSAPDGDVPDDIKDHELTYVSQVLDVYSEYDQITYNNPSCLIGHEEFYEDFTEQRERFFSAEAFRIFYRDNTVGEILEKFEGEILKGIKPALRLRYNDPFQRMCSVLSDAGKLQPSGKLAIHGGIGVKQGYCHHFVNEKVIKWSVNIGK
ncbi:ABC-three component system protein [Enterovibrio norvegicus]|uniref:ABC-three component system protein n=1 Tax=Enterovibrio norvegicus TaxID=188144 RepID=UPI001042090A|nr:ABC-three component system protein [Enterovibrio norvegicus]